MPSEHVIASGAAIRRQEPCKILRVIFYNGDGAVQNLAFSRGGLPSTEPVFKLFALATSPAQYDLGGFVFSDGFTCTPSDADISNIIIEYEDIKQG